MNLTGKHKEMRAVCRVALWPSLLHWAWQPARSALALGMHADASLSGQRHSDAQSAEAAHRPAAVMSGNILNKAVPIYPPDAKKAKIQGTVVLSVVISKDGNVANMRVLSGPPSFSNRRSTRCGSGPTSPIF